MPMSHEFTVNPLIFAGLAVLLVMAIIWLCLVTAGARRSERTGNEKLRAVSLEVASLRVAKADAERAMAVAETRSARTSQLEALVDDREQKLEALRQAKSAADAELAAAREGFNRVQEYGSQLADRLHVAEKLVGSFQESFGILKDEKAAVDEALAASAEAFKHSERAASELRARLANADERLEQANATLGSVRQDAAALKTRIAALEQALEHERRQAEEKIALLTAAREEMAHQFSALAENIMQRHGENFSKTNKEQMETVLGPLRDKLKEFEDKVTATHTESVKERATLAEQLRQIAEAGVTMSRETKELTEALRGSSRTQGAWGEMILDTILQRSGLREGEHYETQQTFAGDEGERLRPDVVINLPGGQKVVIDSKVSLVAFVAMVNAATQQERDEHLQRHLVSLRAHIAGLGGKKYQIVAGSMLDYVVMFIPIEGALAAGLDGDPALTGYAAENNVAIATPTTLMIALRTIANVWQVEARNRNAEDIARRAGLLYDKFAGFVTDMQAIGASIDRSRQQFDSAMNKLATGSGNLVRQAEMLRTLGARASKSLPAALLDTVEAVNVEPTPPEASGEVAAAAE